MPESGPAAISTIARTGYARTSLWLSVLAAFTEGFGAYSLALYPTADIPLQAILVARKESLQHPGSRELAATGHAHEADLLSENIRLGSGSTLDARRHGTGICRHRFTTRPLRSGLIGAGNGRSGRPSWRWRNSMTGRCEIWVFPADPRSSRS